jgi:hypothetical protein
MSLRYKASYDKPSRVAPDELRRQATHALVVGPGEVTLSGPLDLDHARAVVSQLPCAERRGGGMLERDNRDSIERAQELLQLERTRQSQNVLRHIREN